MNAIAALLLCLLHQDDPAEEFQKHVRIETDKVGKQDFHRVFIDETLVYRNYGAKPVVGFPGDGSGRFLSVGQDGKEVLRCQVFKGDEALKVMPVFVDNPERASVSSQGSGTGSVATVDRIVVYDGPSARSLESKVSVTVEFGAGGKKVTRHYVEVYADGKLVYKAGQSVSDPVPPKKKKK